MTLPCPPPLVYTPVKYKRLYKPPNVGILATGVRNKTKDFSTWKEWLMDLVKNSHNNSINK
jgi:hypothetical protein